MVKNKNSNLIAQGTVEEFFGKPSKPIVYGSMKADASIGKFSKKSTAQGTVEYLVILAVVVVISLVVVGIFTNMFSSSSQQVVNSSSKLGTSSGGGISIVEAVLDSAGDSLIKLNNTSSDPITLTKISVGGVDNDFSEQVVGLDSKTFSLSNLTSGCTCASGQKSVSCEYIITYTQNGIAKTDRINKTIECVTDSVPVNVNVVVQPIDECSHSPADPDCWSIKVGGYEGAYIWGGWHVTTGVSTDTLLFNGKDNTAILIALESDPPEYPYYFPPAHYCYNLTEGGVPVGTWYLPSRAELSAGWDALGSTGFPSNEYPSSTEYLGYEDTMIWYLHSNFGTMNSGGKNIWLAVRCLR